MTDALNALSPLDGRYANRVNNLRPIFSEYGLIKKRVLIEINWLIHLSADKDIKEIPRFSKNSIQALNECIAKFNLKDAKAVKLIEQTTNHDVKAIEYWLKKHFKRNVEISNVSEFIHFACTSEDINNLSYALMIKDGLNEEIIPMIESLYEEIRKLSKKYSNISMLARTHGQTASPTTLGKELANIAYRLRRQLTQLKKQPILGKINGAVGNFNAHQISFPQKDWNKFSKEFIEKLGLQFNPYTTQIEPHDFLAEIFNSLALINTILIDFNRDIWGYISMGYFNQKLKKNEVGSSTMPHKVNPIDFENSEGNLGMANAIFEFLSAKLPISRLQRDLTDSTVLRNIGVPFGHTIIGLQSTFKGLGKLLVNTTKIEDDLNANWAVVAEAVQTILRKEGYPNPYEALKELTRTNTIINRDAIQQFIAGLDVDESLKAKLKTITPFNYTGI